MCQIPAFAGHLGSDTYLWKCKKSTVGIPPNLQSPCMTDLPQSPAGFSQNLSVHWQGPHFVAQRSQDGKPLTA